MLYERWRGHRRVWLTGGSAVVVVGVLAYVILSGGGASGARDRAATYSYLAAGYADEQAVIANRPATMRAFESLERRIVGECAGVMAGREDERGSSRSFARRVGESKREDEQLSDLEEELSDALESTSSRSNRQATLTFISAIRLLHWSDSAITQQVRLKAAELEERLRSPVPDVCADVKAWVSSGYKTLSPATKALMSRREARRPTARDSVQREPVGILLARYEGPREQALVQKDSLLASQSAKSLGRLEDVYERLADVLGLSRSARQSRARLPN
jgi:hypothetical protein